jgi:hypothetical protein
MNRFFTLLVSFFLCFPLLADEGMWMLNNLSQENWNRMHELGLTLTPGQLYHDSLPSLYKAVVQFDGGCTGVAVSGKGLIFTNHHCGYDAIQSQSSIEQDYLKNGFVAQTFEEEIPIFGMFVLYLKETIDVSHLVLDSIPFNISEEERDTAIEKSIAKLKEQFKSTLDKEYEIVIDSYYSGNEYYANIYKMYSDVRLVFAPPSSIGKFGGETDNWMWPRHTGDFSIFRVYAGEDNEPAVYDPANRPYQPVDFAPVSLEGYKEDSFAMAMGFPGRTNRYLSSWGVERRIKSSNEPRIDVRGVKQNIWKEAMAKNPETYIKYASKYAMSANYWKNSIGMNRGIEKKQVIERKQTIENQFKNWIAGDPDKRKKYEKTLDLLQEGYAGSMDKMKTRTYISEAFHGAEVLNIAYCARSMDFYRDKVSPETYFNDVIAPHYKDFDAALDEKVLAAMLEILKKNISANQLPSIFPEIDKKYKGNYAGYVAEIFKESIFVSQDKLKEVLLNKKKFKKLEKDPVYKLSLSVMQTLDSLHASLEENSHKIKKGERLFMAGLREMTPGKHLPSDANFTMRLTYGKVGGYEPYDGAWYDYYTTTKGVFEKYDSKNPEFNVQPGIMDLLQKKDFGKYGNNEGDMNLNFLCNLDITGGNSGSPVFDGKGRIIGLAFDGNWEAMSGDIAFETDIQKCIAVDIRYVLFIIEKWGQCQRILDELTIK